MLNIACYQQTIYFEENLNHILRNITEEIDISSILTKFSKKSSLTLLWLNV